MMTDNKVYRQYYLYYPSDKSFAPCPSSQRNVWRHHVYNRARRAVFDRY